MKKQRASVRWILLVVICLVTRTASAETSDAPLTMQVGETRVLTCPGVKRVAVGNGQVLTALAPDGGEVIVFARQEGLSSLHVWSVKGLKKAFMVRVEAAGLDRMKAEVASLLRHIPRASSVVVGDKIVIEGDDLSDTDRRRIAALVERYPQALDFTSEVGWDRMVMLDVQVIELPRSRMRELGVRWDSSTAGGLNGGFAWDTAGVARLTQRPGESPLETLGRAAPGVGYFGVNALLSSRIDALAQSGEAVVLAQPQLVARSGSMAEFLAGGEVPYTVVDSTGRSSTVFKPYGVSLRITPTAEANGIVRSRIEVEASSVDATMASATGPALKTRRTATEFNVRSGQTMVLAGFISREKIGSESAVPGLSKLPLLGGLFRTRRHERRDTELAIFVTPVVLSRDDSGLAERVRRGQAIAQEAFGPSRPRMNVAPASPSGDAQLSAVDRWDPYAGAGSQWKDAESPGQSARPASLAAPLSASTEEISR